MTNEQMATAELLATGDAFVTTLDDIKKLISTRDERIAQLEAVIESDRTRIVDGVNKVNRVLDGYFWMTEGRGNYAWDDDRYRLEFGNAARAILKALESLRKIGADLKDCPKTTDEVVKARQDKDARIAELEAERDALAAKYQDSYAEACHLAAVMQSGQPAFDALGLLLTSFHADPAAILAARDARVKREGALEALRGLPSSMSRPRLSDYPDDEERMEREAFALGFNAYRAHIDAGLAALDAEEKKGGK